MLIAACIGLLFYLRRMISWLAQAMSDRQARELRSNQNVWQP